MTTSRPLTSGERTLAASVFGDAIDYDRVRIHHRKWFWLQPRHVAMAPDGHIWFHPLGRLFREDFCRASLDRSEEHTSELQSLMRISYAVFCLKKKKSATS